MPASGHSHDHAHTASDGLTSVSVQVPGSIPLATLQRLLEKVASPAAAESESAGSGDSEDACLAWGSVLIRMKGVLCIREFPLARVNLSIAGRCRIQLDDDGTWQTAPQCTLVAIGRFHENQANAQARLAYWLSEAAAATAAEQDGAADGDSKHAALLEELQNRISADNRFDVLPPKHGICRFQLTCAKMLHHDVFTIHTRHGVDFERVNRALAEAVNMRTIEHGQTVLFIHTDDGGGGSGGAAENGINMCVAFSVASRDPLRTWEVVQQQADAIVQRFFSHIHSCSCGL